MCIFLVFILNGGEYVEGEIEFSASGLIGELILLRKIVEFVNENRFDVPL